ncbi:hypothetical protein LXL04_016455 [Taraxacum kok-saghyz]
MYTTNVFISFVKERGLITGKVDFGFLEAGSNTFTPTLIEKFFYSTQEKNYSKRRNSHTQLLQKPTLTY